MLQVREKKILLRKWSGGTTRLRTLERTLIKNQHLLEWRRRRMQWKKMN